MKKFLKFELLLSLLSLITIIMLASILVHCFNYFGHLPKTYVDNDPYANNMQSLSTVFFWSYVTLHLLVLFQAVYLIVKYFIKKTLGKILFWVEIFSIIIVIFFHLYPLRIFVLWIFD